MSDKLYWVDRSESIEAEKHRRALYFDSKDLGQGNGDRWCMGAFKKNEEEAAVIAFRRGMEMGIRLSMERCRRAMNVYYKIPDIEKAP